MFNYCDALTSIVIPDKVESIDANAFGVCRALTSITIPSSVTSIGSGAFDYCNDLTDVYYTGTEEQWSKITIGPYYNDSLTKAAIHFNSAVSPVTNLKNVSGNAISWTKSPTAVKYYIFKNGEKVAATLNTTFTFQTLTVGQTYEIGVVAVNAKGEQSMMTKVSLNAVSMLEKPTGLSRNSASLCWNAVPGAKSYKVYVVNPKNGKYVKTFSGVKGTSFTFQGMTDGRSYQLRVRAVDENGVLGKYASTKTFTYQVPAVAPIKDLKNASGNAVTWTKSAEAVSYGHIVNPSATLTQKKLEGPQRECDNPDAFWGGC